jgi:8-oxo-dGTP diphosphatase
MAKAERCPHCGGLVTRKGPLATVDVVVFAPGRGVVLVRRKNPPLGFALPGGFVDEGETCEQAAVREAREETGLAVVLTGIVGVYSDPARDPRGHTLSVVYAAAAEDPDRLAAGDDAAETAFHPLESLPELAFDHGRIIEDFKAGLRRLAPDPRTDAAGG